VSYPREVAFADGLEEEARDPQSAGERWLRRHPQRRLLVQQSHQPVHVGMLERRRVAVE